MKNGMFILLCALFMACVDTDKKTKPNEESIESAVFNDSIFVLDNTFPPGDARRYGVTAANARKAHPITGKNRLLTALDIAEQSGMEMSFPSGYYDMDLTLDHRKNLNLRFNNSGFNLIHITQIKETFPKPENISLKGKLIVYDRLGITEALGIEIDSVIIKSDPTKNIRKMRSRGCHIYHGCKDIKIGYLEIEDFGSGDKTYQYNHAALALDGWNNNPENVQIKKIHIKSTDRHGIYITGKDHLIGDVVIDKFGMGSSVDMAPMQDAQIGEEKDFKALWVNKCYNSFIENIIINEKDSKGKYTAHFDYGDALRPFTIGKFKVINNNPEIEILEEDVNGVVIEINED
ncbi:hypothetical protein [Aestuariivivens sediminicola]|uniref:hypothetical protein n=1 Tax=Aestuariivivens sediminicola TaxID=2913560 RepID=UPI001F59D2E6|nr:hypothetical protein [Aestuariivivens sediminicola]